MQFFEDRIGRCDLFYGPAVRVIDSHEVADAPHELLDAGERATADRLVSDHADEAR